MVQDVIQETINKLNKIKKIIVWTIIIIVLIFVFLIIGLVMMGNNKIKNGVFISTDKTEYSIDENPILKIKNNLNAAICFSTNFPYIPEIKNGNQWENYKYPASNTKDLVEKCIEPNGLKTFELLNPIGENGIHRFLISVCESCKVGDEFKNDKNFYSNEFLIK